MVVPNGVLFGDGVAASASRRISSRASTSTRSSASPTVSSPPYLYSDQSPLLREESSPTKEVWFYEQPSPEGRKRITRKRCPSVSRSSSARPGGGHGTEGSGRERRQAWLIPVREDQTTTTTWISGIRKEMTTIRASHRSGWLRTSSQKKGGLSSCWGRSRARSLRGFSDGRLADDPPRRGPPTQDRCGTL